MLHLIDELNWPSGNPSGDFGKFKQKQDEGDMGRAKEAKASLHAASKFRWAVEACSTPCIGRIGHLVAPKMPSGKLSMNRRRI